MGAGHLDDEGALDLIPGLGALDECQAGIHSDLGNPAVRQPSRCNELLERGCDERARYSSGLDRSFVSLCFLLITEQQSVRVGAGIPLI